MSRPDTLATSMDGKTSHEYCELENDISSQAPGFDANHEGYAHDYVGLSSMLTI